MRKDKCRWCGEQLPMSSGGKKPWPTMIEQRYPDFYVHAVRCYKEVLLSNKHITWLWQTSLSNDVARKSTMRWLTGGYSPLVKAVYDEFDHE